MSIERDERGRFRKGTTGNPNGRPPGPTTADYKDAIRTAVTVKDVVEIVEKAVEQAKRGNDPARRFVFSTLGLMEVLVDVTSGGEKLDSGFTDSQRLALLAELAKRAGGEAAGPVTEG